MLRFKKILCPIDFSAPSRGALEAAVRMAVLWDAELTVLHVTPPIALEVVPDINTIEGDEATRQTIIRERMCRDIVTRIETFIGESVPLRVPIRPEVRIGDTALEILRSAEAEGYDLIVMGTHGLTGWRHMVLGSVAEEVVRLAPCPVLTIRAPQTESAEAESAEAESTKAKLAETERVGSERVEAPRIKAQPAASASTAISIRVADPWTVAEADFPLRGSAADKLGFLLNYAVLAPSSHNTQPWLWKLSGDTVELHADRTRALHHVDPQHRELIMSCGAALFHLRVALQHFGYKGEVAILPDPTNPNLLARIGLGHPTQAPGDAHLLFQAIVKRRTYRMAFEDRPLPHELRQELKDAARGEGADLFFVADDERDAVVDLIEKGDWIQGHDPDFRSELAEWLRPNRSAQHDGIPGYALGLSDLTSHLAPLAVRFLDIGPARAGKDRPLAEKAPVLALLQTDNDTPRDWLAAGQALARVLLRARMDGIYASFFNQPIEVERLWPQLRLALGIKSHCPQMLLRMGYATEGAELRATPRRPVPEVMAEK